MKEYPIIFSGPMVRAILAGQKTQTRRIITGKVALRWLEPGMFSPGFVADPGNGLCPYGYPGDHLWMRETWQENTPPSGYIYRADDIAGHIDRGWRPSIFMPRKASRLTLEVTEVRVQRLQEISEGDAKAEGMLYHDGLGSGCSGYRHDRNHGCVYETAAQAFAVGWDKINGKRGSWDSNPWVWIITFRMIV